MSILKIILLISLSNFFVLSLIKAEETLLSHTKKINSLISEYHAKNKITPNPRVDDSVFVRRAYLNIIGRIPTASEAVQYIDSKDFRKKEKLISKLIDSEGYVSHQYNWWADILRVNTRMQGQSPSNGMAYSNWIKKSIRENKSYDNCCKC